MAHDSTKSTAKRMFKVEDMANSGKQWRSPAFDLLDPSHPAVTGQHHPEAVKGAGTANKKTSAVAAARGEIQESTNRSGSTKSSGYQNQGGHQDQGGYQNQGANMAQTLPAGASMGTGAGAGATAPTSGSGFDITPNQGGQYSSTGFETQATQALRKDGEKAFQTGQAAYTNRQ